MITTPLPANIENKIKSYLESSRVEEKAKSDFIDVMRYFQDQIEFHRQGKADRSELKELIVEMRAGFKAMDKRFDDLIHQMDKRFEAVDKRFEAVDKRFDDLIHQMDKRFEAVDRRFAVFQWVMGVGFATTFSMLLALLGLFLNTPGQAG